ncbi:MAG: TAXI family TRAP transporter solute-binding subunit [Rhodobacteraceae bacterium]|nr:TAXI family TRAP transporter solute-binding subunit [Paracoccaceae bacterium]MCP5342135.1 TAXI family TRAP transporter solute-binding subunit [Paracoccaceae bacterium]
MTKILLVIALAFSFRPGAAMAQSLSLATSGDGTAIYYYGLAISKVSNEVSGLDIRPKPYASAGQGAVFVNSGEVDFGLYNAIVLREAFLGLEFFKDRPLENLRAVARLMPFQLTFGTRASSGITTVVDLRGKRVPAGFDATAFGERLYAAMLGTAGLSYQDVVPVQVSDWAGLGKAFVRGTIDVNGLVVGSATATRYAEQVDDYRAVSLMTGNDAEKRLQEVFPASRLVTVMPGDGLSGIVEPTVVMEYDYWLFAHKDTPDQAVRDVLRTLFAGQALLSAASKDFRNFDPQEMYDEIGVPFHPAALAFYDEKGLR